MGSVNQPGGDCVRRHNLCFRVPKRQCGGLVKKIDPINGIVLPVAVTGVEFGKGPYDLEFGPGGDLFASDLINNQQHIIRIALSTVITSTASIVTANGLLSNGAVAGIEFNARNAGLETPPPICQCRDAMQTARHYE